MIAYAGMGDKLPNLCYYNSQEQWHKPYSETTAELSDNEVKALIAEQYERAKRILLQYKEGHHQLASLLMEREVIFAEDAEKIFGKRPWASRSEEILEPIEATGTIEPVAASTPVEPTGFSELPKSAEPSESSESSEEPSKPSEPTKPAKPKSDHPRKRKDDDNLFGGFEFD